MALYTLNTKSLSSYSIEPGQAPNSNLAMTGAWDMPGRTGKTHHIWDEDNGLEPYLRADEIFFSGRDIFFYGYIKADSREGALIKVNEFFTDIDAFSGLVPFSSNWGTWNVYVKKEVKIEYIIKGYSRIELTLREPVVDLNGVITNNIGSGPGIDGIPFSSLGLTKLKTENQFSRPETKSVEFTQYGSEGYQISKRGFRDFELKFATKQPTYTAFQAVIQNLHALFSKPGARTLTLDDGSTREFFIKDGFKVSGVRKMGEQFFGIIDVKITEIRMLEQWNKLTDSSGLILVDKHGQPLTEIIKKF